jgi:hypothetical protein
MIYAKGLTRAEYFRRYYKENKERYRRYKSRISAKESNHALICKKRGITPDQYKGLLERQNGVCGICRKPPTSKRLAIDHDHKTGSNRGLLCWKCNYGLGLWNDDPERHRQAAKYLEEHSD